MQKTETKFDQSAADEANRQALDALGARIDAAKGDLEGRKPAGPGKYQGLTLAWRMVLELVSGTAVGFAIGYGIDAVLGTAPVIALVFTLFGGAAGMKMMFRTARAATNGASGQQGTE